MKKNYVKNAIKTVTNALTERADTREQPTHYNRAQKRAIERAKFEINSQYKALCDRFLNFMMNSEEVDKKDAQEKLNTLNAQWITYCHARHINEKAHSMVKDYCLKVLKHFFKAEEVKI